MSDAPLEPPESRSEGVQGLEISQGDELDSRPVDANTPDAEEIVLQLEKLRWEIIEPNYKSVYENQEYPNYLGWEKRKETILQKVGLRARDESLMGRVVRAGGKGKLTYREIYGEDWNGSEGYKVLSTRPGGEVRVARKTRVVVLPPV